MYSTPQQATNQQETLQDIQISAEMKALFKAGWQHDGEGHWMQAANDRRYSLHEAYRNLMEWD